MAGPFYGWIILLSFLWDGQRHHQCPAPKENGQRLAADGTGGWITAALRGGIPHGNGDGGGGPGLIGDANGRHAGEKHPQGLTQLPGDLPRFRCRKAGPAQKLCQRIALDVFFQHRNPAIFPCYLHDLRQVRAGNGEQFLVHFSAAIIVAKNQPLSILFVLQQKNTATRAGFHHAYSFIIRCHAMQQILINGGFPLFHYAPGILISSAQNSIIIR